MFAVGDCPTWTNRRPPEAPGVPTLQQMFTLVQRMGYEMRPISKQSDAPRQQSGDRPPVDQNRGFVPKHGLDVITLRSSVSVVTVWTHAITWMDADRELDEFKWETPRDLTHFGLHVHHSTSIHPSCTKSSWDSSSPDTTITYIHQQNPV